MVDNLNRLADYLDGIREKYGKPIFISSGYRCPLLNQAVGGVANSQHLKGLAADLICADMENFCLSFVKQRGLTKLLPSTTKVAKVIGFMFQFHLFSVNREIKLSLI